MTTRPAPYSGVIPPVVTPLTADGELDRPSLERVVGHLLDGGVSGLFALGSSGETAYLTPGQQDEVIKVITAASGGQVPVLVGAIETTTNRAIERGRAAAALGADAVVVTAPFYTRTHATEIDRHFRTSPTRSNCRSSRTTYRSASTASSTRNCCCRSPPTVCWQGSRTPAGTTVRSAGWPSAHVVSRGSRCSPAMSWSSTR